MPSSSQVLTLEMDVSVRIAFAPRGDSKLSSSPNGRRGRPAVFASRRSPKGPKEAHAHDAGEPLGLTITKQGLSWLPILVRVHDFRVEAKARVVFDFARNSISIAFLPEGGGPQVYWDIDTKLGLFPIPNWVQEILPKQVAAKLATFGPDSPLLINLDVQTSIFTSLFFETALDPTIVARAVPLSVDDADLEKLLETWERKAAVLRKVLAVRRKWHADETTRPRVANATKEALPAAVVKAEAEVVAKARVDAVRVAADTEFFRERRTAPATPTPSFELEDFAIVD